MKILKRWDLYYWVIVIILLWAQMQQNINTPEYQWTGLAAFTILIPAIIIYVIAKCLQLLIRKK